MVCGITQGPMHRPAFVEAGHHNVRTDKTARAGYADCSQLPGFTHECSIPQDPPYIVRAARPPSKRERPQAAGWQGWPA